MPPLLPPYRPPSWLFGPHSDTVYPALALKRPPPAYRREIWNAPDGDEIAIDWLAAPAAADAPLLVHFHGLEGSSASHYASAIMHAAADRKWFAAVAHFRGCGGHPNRKPRTYHAGDSNEIDWILKRFRDSHNGVIYAAGVSLGGNALAKWLGEQGQAADNILQSAAIISAPLDLVAAGKVLDSGLNKAIYTREFMRSLRRKTLVQLSTFEAELAFLKLSPAEVIAATTFKQFDAKVTAPLHGFKGVDDYWTQASAKPQLKKICIPTLVLNARNDPFLPASALPNTAEVSSTVTLLQPDRGGHVGFVEGPFPGRIDWLPRCLLAFFASNASSPSSQTDHTD
ncbi:YheT family hydrolase [Chitinimonas sp. BJB300]|uniref:YheT family hydrolase n=1 Tax=Chitinimonas sp. BJB300 TaxID=1559339 RepID=UPI000C0E46DA|nr:alpha/beta fold hydrolase [Chitinimonas sp. BJB300]PHV10339.1 alpha/beta hydrolase [Chitinimonas sp. BJB300]TSJ85550.1 alpha/beta fold hydrolase [Chitinimonas sp. BJB300]